jgi:hypothetical protein
MNKGRNERERIEHALRKRMKEMGCQDGIATLVEGYEPSLDDPLEQNECDEQ